MEKEYYVYACSHDKNNIITGYESEYGPFDNIEEAKKKFDEVVEEFNKNFPLHDNRIETLDIALEVCEHRDWGIVCVDMPMIEYVVRPVDPDDDDENVNLDYKRKED